MITSKIRSKIKVLALERKNEEICGFIVFKNCGYEIIACENIAEDRCSNFMISGLDYLRASKHGEIVCVYHSHPLGNKNESSFVDKLSANVFNLPILAYIHETDQFDFVIPNNNLKSYVNREYCFGQFDCASIVVDFYKQELGVEFGGVDTETLLAIGEHADEKTFEFYKDEFCKRGFKQIPIENFNDLEFGDILFLPYYDSPISCHFIVYIGGNLILHHPAGQKSKIEFIRPLHLTMSKGIFRYEKIG